MQNEIVHKSANAMERVPTCATWPPPWLDTAGDDSTNLAPAVLIDTPEATTQAEPVAELAVDWWSMIPAADLAYLTAPRRWPSPCAWCGGRTVHAKPCQELRGSWAARMPFGKHKGRRVSETPADYLQWLVRNNVRPNDAETREAVEARAGIFYRPAEESRS